MSGYILRRLLAMIPVLLVVALVVFALIHIAPGDPAALIVGTHATEEKYELIVLEKEEDDNSSVIYAKRIAMDKIVEDYNGKEKKIVYSLVLSPKMINVRLNVSH